jgi:hypothetical protein
VRDVYEYLEAEGFQYAIRLPANQVLQAQIAPLLTRPVGRPPAAGVELRPACVLGVPSSGRKPPGDDPDPRGGRRSPLSPA